ncbi:MAG: DUF115 domain-containing protein [Lentisphaeraceae bacterium]|nr:DUF115 domain-containing protein [Lentisphaeraceae bacterium]
MNATPQSGLLDMLAGSELLNKIQSVPKSQILSYDENGLAYWLLNGKSYPLQSKRNPEREAQSLVNHWLGEDITSPKVIGLLGVSSQFIINELLKRLPSESHIILLESSYEYLNEFLKTKPLKNIPNDIHLHILADEELDGLMKAFRKTIAQIPVFCTGLYMVPSIIRMRPGLSTTKEVLARAVKLEAMDRGTTAAFSDEWIQNSIINLPELSTSTGVIKLSGQYTKTDALVICAGPSLNDSLEQIKEMSQSCLTIVVGTALRPVLAAGIKPDITIVVDSDPKVFKQFDGIDDLPGHLACSYTCFPGIVQKYHDKLIPYNCVVSQDFAIWLRTVNIDHGTLNVGGTVALSALDLARIAGCPKIFTFGLDLAYADDGTSHAQNSMYDNQKQLAGLVKVKGNRQEYVQTTGQFAGYIDIINNFTSEKFSDYAGRLFNVNTAGAQFKYMDLIHPDDCLSKYSKEPKRTSLDSLLQEDTKENTVRSIASTAVEELKDLAYKAETVLKMSTEKINDKIFADFESSLRHSTVCNQLLNQAMQAWCMKITSGSEDPNTLSLNLAKQIQESSEWVFGLLENSLDRLNKQRS